MSRKYLFYITQNYSFEILRPLQEEIQTQGHECAWYAHGKNVSLEYFLPLEQKLQSIQAAIDYNPDATFIPGNVVPYFIPGLKVQVFHGLEYKKKGHFGIRGFFDLYCTHGPITTNKFNLLAKKHEYFAVAETGWPKLDPLFTTEKLILPYKDNRTSILYAPTFSPALTSSTELLKTITEQIKLNTENWLFKFHPKMDKELIAPYQLIADSYDNVHLISNEGVAPALQTADILLSDTSSVIGEFLLLNKPVITYKNSRPGKELLEFNQPKRLAEMISLAINPDAELRFAMIEANKQLHPFKDGKSSSRILDAVEKLLLKTHSELKNKPLNLFRNLKQRKKHNYWKF